MKNNTYPVIIFAIILAFLAGFLASNRPDGLQKVAEDMGFLHKTIHLPSLSTVIAGIFGIILIIFIFHSIANARHIGTFLKNLINQEKDR